MSSFFSRRLSLGQSPERKAETVGLALAVVALLVLCGLLIWVNTRDAEPAASAARAAPRPAPAVVPVPPAPQRPAFTGPLTETEAGADRMYQVGVEIKPGVWGTAGPVAEDTPTCYFARLSSGTGKPESVIPGSEVITKHASQVTIRRSDKFFRTMGCLPWKPVEDR